MNCPKVKKLLEWALTFVELLSNMPEIRLKKTINLRILNKPLEFNKLEGVRQQKPGNSIVIIVIQLLSAGI